MSFRRIPFQFTTTDPVERQLELEKRFGLPTTNNMFVDFASPLSKGTGNKDLSSSSPRLQHRVPIFIENQQPVKVSVDSANTYSEKKPKVRIVPIQIEGSNSESSRHRTLSGPAGLIKENETIVPCNKDIKHSMQDLSKSTKIKATAEPKGRKIPVKIEGDNLKSEKVIKALEKENSSTNSKLLKKPVEEKEQDYNISLKKIENILEELKAYESGVQEFNGIQDKQYRYLDEMLTRCMLRLDDIDTMGCENVRSARKAAIKKVQACIDLLESKIKPQVNGDLKETEINKDVDMIENKESSENETSPTESSDAPSTQKLHKVEMPRFDASNDSIPQEGDAVEVKMLNNETEVDNDFMPKNTSSGITDIEIMDNQDTEREMENVSILKTDSNEVEMKEQNCISSVPSATSLLQPPIVTCEPMNNDVEMKDINLLNSQEANELQEELSVETIPFKNSAESVEQKNNVEDDSTINISKSKLDNLHNEYSENEKNSEKLLESTHLHSTSTTIANT